MFLLEASSNCRPSSLLPCSQMSRNTRLGRRDRPRPARRRCCARCGYRSLRPAGFRRPARGYRLRRRRSGYRMPLLCRRWLSVIRLPARSSAIRGRGRTASALKRNCIQAPRAPGILSAASRSSSCRRAPRESGRRSRARGRYPFRASSRRARADARGFPSAGRCHCRRRRSRCRRPRARRRDAAAADSAGGTAATASVAFLMMLVSACEISRRSKRAGIGLGEQLGLDIDVGCRRASGTRPGARCRRRPRRRLPAWACGRSAKLVDHAPMSSTWRTIVSVHCSNTAGPRRSACCICAAAAGR